jgi:hypothetical protein
MLRTCKEVVALINVYTISAGALLFYNLLKIQRVISKRDGYINLKQIPSSDGSLGLIWRDPVATFC